MDLDDKYLRYCTRTNSLPAEVAVSEWEERLGIKLPGRYRHYLLKYNGGEFSEPVIPGDISGNPEDGVRYMHGIGAWIKNAELGRERDLNLWDGNFPPVILPIGYTTLGNFINLMVANDGGDDYGNVALTTPNSTFWLADSIDDFFSILGPPTA